MEFRSTLLAVGVIAVFILVAPFFLCASLIDPLGRGDAQFDLK